MTDQKTKSVKPGRGVRHGCHTSLFLFHLYNEYLTKEALERSGDFKIRGQVIHGVKYAVGLCYWLRKKWYYRAC
jgi:hypothetical protein